MTQKSACRGCLNYYDPHIQLSTPLSLLRPSHWIVTGFQSSHAGRGGSRGSRGLHPRDSLFTFPQGPTQSLGKHSFHEFWDQIGKEAEKWDRKLDFWRDKTGQTGSKKDEIQPLYPPKGSKMLSGGKTRSSLFWTPEPLGPQGPRNDSQKGPKSGPQRRGKTDPKPPKAAPRTIPKGQGPL